MKRRNWINKRLSAIMIALLFLCGYSPAFVSGTAETGSRLGLSRAIGSAFGGYTVTDVLPSGAQSINNQTNKVYEVTGGNGEIKVTGNSQVVLILNGTTRSGSFSQLQVDHTAKVTLYLVEGTVNSFTCSWTGMLGAGGVYAGIYVAPSAALTIEGPGTLAAKGGSGCAGIGGINNGNTTVGTAYRSGTITIHSGAVTATGGYGGAGIGGGIHGGTNTITINGGTVTAIAGATGGAGVGGAGIGGGGTVNNSKLNGVSPAGTIHITGGTVTATARESSAGIGGGYNSACGTINISGGKITATGAGQAAGIGSAYTATGTINISGGVMDATSGNTTVPGVGGSSNHTISVTGGSIQSKKSDGTILMNNGKNGSGQTVYLFILKLTDGSGSLLAGAEISVNVPGTPAPFTARANNVGVAYLWLPAGTYSTVLTNSMTGDTALYEMVVPASSTGSDTVQVVGGYPKSDFTASPEDSKVYAPLSVATLTLAILPDGATDKTVSGVTWFRESVGNPAKPIYTQDTFGDGYASAATGNKGTLTRTGSSGQSDLYAMAVDKNGRYWVQIRYIEDGTGDISYRAKYVDVDNIYAQAEVYVRDWNVTEDAQAKPYTVLALPGGAPYGIPFDLDGSTILSAPRLGYDTLTYTRNPAFPGTAWGMAVPGSPFEATAANAGSSSITLHGQVDANEDKTANSGAAKKYYTVNYFERTIEAIIDLSMTTVGDTNAGYEVTGTAGAYNPNPGGAVSVYDRKLTFNANANGKTFQITQTGIRANASGLNSPKEGTSLYNNITVNANVTVKLIISNIYLIGSIVLEDKANVTVMLEDANYVVDYIKVPAGAEITIDSLNKSNVADRLTIPAPAGSNNSYAGIGGAGGGAGSGAATHGGHAGTITINGGKIDITSKSAGACIGGGGGRLGGASGSVYAGYGGNGGTVNINGGDISVTQHGSDYAETQTAMGIGGAGIGGGGGDSNRGGDGGTVNITGGKVTVRQRTRAAGIGAGTFGTPGDITISGGDVDVEVVANGAGSGIGGCGGTSPSATGNITITGGTVRSVSPHTGIGLINSYGDCHILITGGTIYAKGGMGPGIGFTLLRNDIQTQAKRDIKITGGDITAESTECAGVGSGNNSSGGPPLHLDAAANVRAYSSAGTSSNTPTPAIYAQSITGDGFFVNAGFVDRDGTPAAPFSRDTELSVYENGQRAPLLKTLHLPASYRFFAYSSDQSAERVDNIYYAHATGAGFIVRHVDSQEAIYSVRTRNGYNKHNGNANSLWLPV